MNVLGTVLLNLFVILQADCLREDQSQRAYYTEDIFLLVPRRFCKNVQNQFTDGNTENGKINQPIDFSQNYKFNDNIHMSSNNNYGKKRICNNSKYYINNSDNKYAINYQQIIESALLRYLTYLEGQWKTLGTSDVQHLLLGLTISLAQLQSKSTSEIRLEYIKFKISRIHSVLFLKLSMNGSLSSKFCNQIFNSALWQTGKPLGKLTEERMWASRSNTKLKLNGERSHGIMKSFNQIVSDSRNSWESWKDRSKFFLETRLVYRSNKCLQGLLEDCSVSEECRGLMMEQAGGYSLAHQTLYFILARQNNCTLWDTSNSESTQSLIQERCQRMAEVNKAILTIGNMHNGDREAHRISPVYVDLYIENCVVCGMEGSPEFLSLELAREILDHQTERGCFARYQEGCDHHLSAVSIAYLSILLSLL